MNSLQVIHRDAHVGPGLSREDQAVLLEEKRVSSNRQCDPPALTNRATRLQENFTRSGTSMHSIRHRYKRFLLHVIKKTSILRGTFNDIKQLSIC